MLRLVQADGSPARESNLRDRSPSSLFDVGALDSLLHESVHLGSEVVAHEVQLVPATFVGRMDGQLCRRKGEDQPVVTCIHEGVRQDISKECSIGRSVPAVASLLRRGLAGLRERMNPEG